MKKGKVIECIGCKKSFYSPMWKLLRGNKYCSYKCYWNNKHDVPWNKGVKTGLGANSGSFISSKWEFSGNMNEYKSLHYKVRRLFGVPGVCEFCGSDDRTVWANKTGNYSLERVDWLQLCYRCHFNYDNVESRRLKNAGN